MDVCHLRRIHSKMLPTNRIPALVLPIPLVLRRSRVLPILWLLRNLAGRSRLLLLVSCLRAESLLQLLQWPFRPVGFLKYNHGLVRRSPFLDAPSRNTRLLTDGYIPSVELSRIAWLLGGSSCSNFSLLSCLHLLAGDNDWTV